MAASAVAISPYKPPSSVRTATRVGRSARPLFVTTTAALPPLQPYLAKSWRPPSERRGWVHGLSFVIPLTVLSFTTWYVSNGLDVPVGFNTVFYAAMVASGVIVTNLTDVDVRLWDVAGHSAELIR